MEPRSIIHVFGEPIEILVSSTDSNYTMCVAMQTSPPGGGPPPHKHDREEETFIVLEGEFEFFDRDKWVPFKKGDTRFSLRGTYHGFRNVGSTPGKMLFVTNGGGLDEYFALISRLRLPDDMARLIEISDNFGYHYLPAPE
ncbi:cupin domain-containing protein [Silvibacterium acidisoli]|uniref:cupin domain-containing protein n=1 Tax=Acidobacteriaceae bacterium ZG23-2 TaxID=2883246 RepID=UPI00406C0014